MTDTEIVEVLRGTKERLFERGWIKNKAGTEGGPNCILGAISWVAEMNGGEYEIVRDAISERRKDLVSSVIKFNDADETTFDDVLDFLDSHIKRLEG